MVLFVVDVKTSAGRLSMTTVAQDAADVEQVIRRYEIDSIDRDAVGYPAACYTGPTPLSMLPRIETFAREHIATQRVASESGAMTQRFGKRSEWHY
jgi:hypothetical protein